MQFSIDGFDQTDVLGEEVHGADAAMSQAAAAVGDFVMDVGGGEDGLVEVLELGLIEPLLNAPLAAQEASSYLGVHSKLLFPRPEVVSLLLQTSRKTQEFRAFSPLFHAEARRLRLFKV